MSVGVPMKSEDRRKLILDHLMEVGSATVDDMADRFTVSRMTIHRDLDLLEGDGLLRKIRGGATVQSNSQFESDFQYRKRLEAQEKREIARAAATRVEPGQAIILDDGSTIAAMTEFLLDKRPLTVMTNNAAIVAELVDIQGINLIVLGGEYNRRFHGFFGLVTEQTLQSLRADQAFISTSSVSGTTAFHQDQVIVKTKRAIIAAADRAYLLVDHSKFDRTALHVLMSLSEFDAVITGQPPSEAAQMAMQQADIVVETAMGGD